MKYDNWYVIGEKPKMDTELEKAEFNKKHAEYQENLKNISVLILQIFLYI